MSDKNSTRVKKAIARLKGADSHLLFVKQVRLFGRFTKDKKQGLMWDIHQILLDVRNAKTLLTNMRGANK